MQTSLEYTKKALRIDFDDDDELLEKLIGVAERKVCNDTHRTIAELYEFSDSGCDFPDDLEQAIVALVGAYYNNPEALTNQALNEVDLSYHALIRPYIRLV